MAEGEELPPVVIPLEGNDQSFLDMLERDKAALEQFAEEIKGILADGIGAAAEEGGSRLAEAIGAAGEEGAATLFDEIVAALADAGAAAGLGFREGITREQVGAAQEIAASFDEATPEFAAAGAEAGAAYGTSLREEIEAEAAALEVYIRDDLARGLDEEAQANMAALGQVRAQLAALEGDVLPGGASAGAGANAATAAVDRLAVAETAAAQAAEASSRQQAALASALQAVGVSSGLAADELGAIAASLSDARAAADLYGTSEAQLTVATGALDAAQSALADRNARLLQTYANLATGGTASLKSLQEALAALADAQTAVTDQAIAQIDAQNAVNLAVIEGESAFMDETSAMQAFVSVQQAARVEAGALFDQLQEGDFALLNQSAAMAQAEIKANLLTEAERRLAAANMTVVDTYRQLTEGAEVSSAAQQAALDAQAKAQSEVSALGGAGAAGAADRSRGGGMGGLMYGPGGMLLWNLPFLLPMITQMFGNSGQAAQAYQQQLQQLGSTIAQDGGQIGANTEAALANQIAYSSLSDSLAKYGVNLTQATEYASGVVAVQETVNASLDNQAAKLAQIAGYARSSNPAGTGAAGGTVEGIQAQQAADAKQSLEQLAKAAQEAVEKQNQVTEATLATEKVTGVFTGQVKAASLAMQQNAETAFVNAAATEQWLNTVVPGTDLYTQAVLEGFVALKSQAQQADITAAAQKDYLNWLVPGTQQYTRAVDDQTVALEMNARTADITAAAQRQYLTELIPGTQQYTNAVNDQEAALEMNARTALISAQAQLQYLQLLVPGTQQYNDALAVQHAALLQSASAAGITALAQLNLDGATVQMQQDLAFAVNSYNQATQATTGYSAVLTALNGTAQNFVISEAQFTIALDNVSKAAKNNGTSLDVSTTSGAQNLLMFGQLAQAADKAAESVYQSEVSTKGANVAFNDANAALQREKQAFIDNADKAGFNKGEVQQLADALFKLPKDVPINVSAQVQGAKNAVSALIAGIDSETAFINVFAKQNYSASGLKFNASGGPAYAGVPQVVGDGGREELFVPQSNGYVYPSVDRGLAALGAGGFAGGGEPTVIANVYVDGHLVTAGVRAESRYTKSRNSTTGMN